MKFRNLKIAGSLAVLALVLLFVPGTPSAFGQAGRGSISGTITDPSGAIVPGASGHAAQSGDGRGVCMR